MIKVLKDGYDLSAVGNVDAPLPEVIAQATRFIFSFIRDEGMQKHVAH